MRAEALAKLGCIGLNPTKHGRVVDCHAAIDQHAWPVTVVERELQRPTPRPKDDLCRELPTFNGSILLRIVCQTFAPGLPSLPAHH